MARRKKTMEILETLVDQVIKAPTSDTPKKTRKPRKKKITKLEEVKLEEVKLEEIKLEEIKPIKKPRRTKKKITAGESKSLNPQLQPKTTYKLPVQIRRPGYKIVGL